MVCCVVDDESRLMIRWLVLAIPGMVLGVPCAPAMCVLFLCAGFLPELTEWRAGMLQLLGDSIAICPARQAASSSCSRASRAFTCTSVCLGMLATLGSRWPAQLVWSEHCK
uniref:Uncharacterized protein n=1 Tax=Bionectria ochroleuca TaxID=29856 RepID=A0A8H7ND33_BIOOC